MYKITHTRCSSPPAEVNHHRPFSPSESCARRLTSSALAARFYLFILFYLTPIYRPDSHHPLPTPPLIQRLRLKNYTNPPWEALVRVITTSLCRGISFSPPLPLACSFENIPRVCADYDVRFTVNCRGRG